MRNFHDRFEHWYKLTHWMAPSLDRKGHDDNEYQDTVVQAMYYAYRAGFNRCNKERAEMYELVRREEQDRILRIVYEESTAYGKPGECVWIGVKHKVGKK